MAFTPGSHVHFSPGACLCLSVCRVFVRARTASVLSPGISWHFFVLYTLHGGVRVWSSQFVAAVVAAVVVVCGCFVRFYATRWLLVGNVKLVLCHSSCGPFCGACHHLAISARWAGGGERDETSFFLKKNRELQPGFISARLSNSRADGLTKRLSSRSPGLSIAAANI